MIVKAIVVGFALVGAVLLLDKFIDPVTEWVRVDSDESS